MGGVGFSLLVLSANDSVFAAHSATQCRVTLFVRQSAALCSALLTVIGLTSTQTMRNALLLLVLFALKFLLFAKS